MIGELINSWIPSTLSNWWDIMSWLIFWLIRSISYNWSALALATDMVDALGNIFVLPLKWDFICSNDSLGLQPIR